MHRRAYLRTFAATVGAVGLAGCTDDGSDGDYDVGMATADFLPARIEVEVGDTVVWKNTNTRVHTVTATDAGLPADASYFASGGFDGEAAARSAWRADGGGGIGPEATYRHTFEVPGEYPYICIPHVASNMIGTVVVRPSGEGTDAAGATTTQSLRL